MQTNKRHSFIIRYPNAYIRKHVMILIKKKLYRYLQNYVWHSVILVEPLLKTEFTIRAKRLYSPTIDLRQTSAIWIKIKPDIFQQQSNKIWLLFVIGKCRLKTRVSAPIFACKASLSTSKWCHQTIEISIEQIWNWNAASAPIHIWGSQKCRNETTLSVASFVWT